MKPINLKFCAPFTELQKWKELSNLEKPVFDFLYFIQEEWFKNKIKSVHIGNSD